MDRYAPTHSRRVICNISRVVCTEVATHTLKCSRSLLVRFPTPLDVFLDAGDTTGILIHSADGPSSVRYAFNAYGLSLSGDAIEVLRGGYIDLRDPFAESALNASRERHFVGAIHYEVRTLSC